MSILDSPLKSRPPTFWTIEDFQNSNSLTFPVLWHGILKLKSPNFEHESVNMFLNNRYLYFNPIENLIYKSKISWSIIESFIEDDSDISTFGFTIKKLSGSQDFFVENEEDLEKWLENFSRLGLMSGFDLDYVIIKNIDYGRSGLVSVCQDMLTGAEYAAKRIEKSKLTEPTQRKLLKNEIKSMRKVSSQHTVQLFRVYEDQDFIILIMEYLPHGNLLQRLQKIKTLGEKECSLLMRNIFEALQHFSMIDLLHRDLKLENILMCSNSNNFEIKIIDFGLSCSFNSCDFAKCGSPGFMAPEIFAAGHYDSKIDVFSAGVVCYAALTGKLPFAGKNLNSVVEKNERGEVSFENNDWKHFSPIALNFVRGLLAKNPSLRPNAEQALNHPWIARHIFKCESEIVSGFITFAESNRVNCN